jgi:hypothetical protein
MQSLSLRELQLWMRWAVTDPRGASEAIKDPNPHDHSERYQAPSPSALPLIGSSAKASRENRLDIYAEAYFARLAEVAGSHFPVTKRILNESPLGESAFLIAVNEFLKDNPSATTNIDEVFRAFPDSLEEEQLRSLAAIEWQRTAAVFLYNKQEVLDAAKLAAIVDWPKAVFDFRSDITIVESNWSFESMFQGTSEAEKRRTFYLIRFDRYEAKLEILDALEAKILMNLRCKMSLNDSLNSTDIESTTVSTDLTIWFTKWMEWGIFKDIKTSEVL